MAKSGRWKSTASRGYTPHGVYELKYVDSDDKTTTLIQGSGYENPSRDVNRHVEIEDRYVLSSQNYQNGSFEIPTRGRTIINESGLYSVILRSKMEKANHDGVSDAYPIEIQERIDKLHKFKRWVTSEILHTFTSFAPLTN